MAINLNKAKQIFKGGISNSWTDFYLNMALEMAENVAKSKVAAVGASVIGGTSVLGDTGVIGDFFPEEDLNNIANNYSFAQSLTEEYDKVVRGGKTIVGGRAVSMGNTAAMQASLIAILSTTKLNKNGDLLRDIGPAIQAYWLGAQLEKFPTPNIPCIGSVQNISTILGVNLSPGIWTPISIPPQNSVSPWLLNFIISASIHLLTVGGLFTCNCAYPPPAPPAPGVLPWAGYFIKPFSGSPLSSLDFKDMVSLAGGLALTGVDTLTGLSSTITQTENQNELVSQLGSTVIKGFIEGEQTQAPEIAAAIKSIIYGDEAGMLESSTLLASR